MRKTRTALAAAAACLFAVTACSTTEPEAAGGGDSGDVETGNGVTDSAINIGVLTDLSGPFAAGAIVYKNGKVCNVSGRRPYPEPGHRRRAGLPVPSSVSRPRGVCPRRSREVRRRPPRATRSAR